MHGYVWSFGREYIAADWGGGVCALVPMPIAIPISLFLQCSSKKREGKAVPTSCWTYVILFHLVLSEHQHLMLLFIEYQPKNTVFHRASTWYTVIFRASTLKMIFSQVDALQPGGYEKYIVILSWSSQEGMKLYFGANVVHAHERCACVQGRT